MHANKYINTVSNSIWPGFENREPNTCLPLLQDLTNVFEEGIQNSKNPTYLKSTGFFPSVLVLLLNSRHNMPQASRWCTIDRIGQTGQTTSELYPLNTTTGQVGFLLLFGTSLLNICPPASLPLWNGTLTVEANGNKMFAGLTHKAYLWDKGVYFTLKILKHFLTDITPTPILISRITNPYRIKSIRGLSQGSLSCKNFRRDFS